MPCSWLERYTSCWRCYNGGKDQLGVIRNLHTLVTQIIVQAGKFLRLSKRVGWNKHSGWKIPHK